MYNIKFIIWFIYKKIYFLIYRYIMGTKKGGYKRGPYKKGKKGVRAKRSGYAGGNTNEKISLYKNMNEKMPFSAHYTCKVKYVHTSLLSVGTSGIFGTEQVFRLNSIYDPDFTGSGHQYYGRDQLALIYNNYNVYKIHVRLEISDPSEDGLVVGMLLQPSNGTYTVTSKTVDELRESSNSYTVNMNNSGAQTACIDQMVPIYKVEGVAKTRITHDDVYSSAMTTNPALSPYLRVAVANLRGSGSGTVIVRAIFTAYVHCFGLITLAQS